MLFICDLAPCAQILWQASCSLASQLMLSSRFHSTAHGTNSCSSCCCGYINWSRGRGRFVMIVPFSCRMASIFSEYQWHTLASRMAHWADSLTPGTLDNRPESGKRFCGFFGCFPVRFRKKNVNENKSEKTDWTVEKERYERSKVCVQFLESFCNDKPPQVGRGIGQCVSPPTCKQG